MMDFVGTLPCNEGVADDAWSDDDRRRGAYPLAGARFGMVHAVDRCYEPVKWDAVVAARGTAFVDPVMVRTPHILQADEDTGAESVVQRPALWVRGEEAVDADAERIELHSEHVYVGI